MGTQINVSEEKFIEVYNQYFDMIYKVCFLYMKNDLDAQAMVQSTFAKYLKSKVVFLNEEHGKAWFIVTAAGLCKGVLKSSTFLTGPSTAFTAGVFYYTAEEMLNGIKDILHQENLEMRTFMREELSYRDNENSLVNKDLDGYAGKNSDTEFLMEAVLESKYKQFLLTCLLRMPVKYIPTAYMYYSEKFSAEEIGRYLPGKEKYIKHIQRLFCLWFQPMCEELEVLNHYYINMVIGDIKCGAEAKEKILDSILNGANIPEKKNFYQLYKNYIYSRVIIAVSICLIIIVGSIVIRQEEERFYITGTGEEITEEVWVEAGENFFAFTVEGTNIDTAYFGSEHYLKSASNLNELGSLNTGRLFPPYTFLQFKEWKNESITMEWTPKDFFNNLNTLKADLNLLDGQWLTDIIVYQIERKDQSIYRGGIEIKMQSNGRISARMTSKASMKQEYKLNKMIGK